MISWPGDVHEFGQMQKMMGRMGGKMPGGMIR